MLAIVLGVVTSSCGVASVGTTGVRPVCPSSKRSKVSPADSRLDGVVIGMPIAAATVPGVTRGRGASALAIVVRDNSSDVGRFTGLSSATF